jgi:hypothetical protein
MRAKCDCRSATYTSESFRRLLQLATVILFVSQLVGCVSAGKPSNYGADPVAPAIIDQPQNQSVPMGLTATFALPASGDQLNYQWYKNGEAISGATSEGYTTLATTFADSGSLFTATVSNSLGSVTSNTATLTVTARAPAIGDLRFQQVDAASTVNGYATGPVGIASAIPALSGASFTASIGSPLYMGPTVCASPPVVPELGCEWPFEQYNLPYDLIGLGLSTGYGSDFFTNFPADLQNSSFPALGNPVNAPNSVVTSLDLESPDNLIAASWIQSSQSTGFDMSLQTVSPSDFQAAANQEGAHSRVITAVSYNAGQVVYLSYGWTGDKSTIYETQVMTASIETAESAAMSMANQGFIITALGGSNLDNSYLLVGTRVQGDTVSRPFLTNEGIYTAGYALVGVLQDLQDNVTYLGER